MQEHGGHENGQGKPAPQTTRERILDIALELFTQQGYDKTSLRDIAERLGTTKAALYYHFKSKSAILLELHMRLHAMAERLLDNVESLPASTPRSEALSLGLDELVTEIDDNRDLVELHLRNQNAMSELDDSVEHQAANEQLKRRFQEVLELETLSPETRVRLTCALGAVVGGLFGQGLVKDVSHDVKVDYVRAIVADLFSAR